MLDLRDAVLLRPRDPLLRFSRPRVCRKRIRAVVLLLLPPGGFGEMALERDTRFPNEAFVEFEATNPLRCEEEAPLKPMAGAEVSASNDADAPLLFSWADEDTGLRKVDIFVATQRNH